MLELHIFFPKYITRREHLIDLIAILFQKFTVTQYNFLLRFCNAIEELLLLSRKEKTSTRMYLNTHFLDTLRTSARLASFHKRSYRGRHE